MTAYEMIARARALAALAEKATPGPWYARHAGSEWYDVAVGRSRGRSVFGGSQARENAILTAVAPDMAALLGEMAEKLETAKNIIRELSDYIDYAAPSGSWWEEELADKVDKFLSQ